MESSPRRKFNWLDPIYEWIQFWRSQAARQLSDRRQQECHQEIYDSKYYEFIEFTASWSRDVMADSIMRDLAPHDALDVGCGTGALLDALRSRDVQVTGLEYSDVAIDYCRRRGLPVRKFDIGCDRLPTTLQRRDLAISFEVAEHLPARLANRFIKLLSSASDTVVMSAATSGQGGTNHFNEQPNEYWIEKMASRGLKIDRELSLRWRAEWREKTALWYHSNVMVFRRQETHAHAA